MAVSALVAERGERESCTGASQAAYGIYQASAPVIQHWRALSPRRLRASEIRGMQKVVEAGG